MSRNNADNVMTARLFNCNRHLLAGWTFEQFARDPMYALIRAQVARNERAAAYMVSASIDTGLVFLRRQAD